MSRFFIFIGVIVALIGGIHSYFWVRLVRDTALPLPYRVSATAALVLLAVSLPLPMLVARQLTPAWTRTLAWPSFVWMGLLFLLLLFLLAGDLVRLLALASLRVAGRESLTDPARRTAIARALATLAAGGAALVGAAGIGQALRRLMVHDVDVRIARLPPESDGTTIVQLTDLHVGPTIGRAFIEDVVRRTNALAPDIIAITGDLVDGSVESLWSAVEPLGQLRARHGVYFVTGNHEYYSGVEDWLAALGRLGIRVLANERVAIGEAGGFDLAGVHDHAAHGVGLHRSSVATALAGRDPARPVVLLAHQPKTVSEAAQLGVDLQLSGHTHGGQIWPFSYLVKLAQPYLAGLHRLGATQIYVSPGTGYWGPPMRLGSRAEISRIRLLRDA